MTSLATNIVPLRRDDLQSAPAPWRETPLTALGAMSGRYCAWRGASERRYVASVYSVARTSADMGLPDFDAFVLIAVARGPLGRRIVAATAVERPSDRRFATTAGLLRGAEEWHVHFLAEDRAERAAMVADLIARHGADEVACCA